MAHKKKKEEFDPSLTGGYLPGARAPVAAIAPKLVLRRRKGWILPQTPILIMNPHSHEYGVEHEHWEGGLLEKPEGFLKAFAYYGFVGVADPWNVAEAFAWKKGLGIPWLAGYALAGVRGFVLGGLVLTLIDPKHQWEGGLDETIGYQNFVSPLNPGSPAPSGGWWDWNRWDFDIGGMGPLT